LLPIDHDTVGAALALSAPALGANDRIHVATCTLNDIETIVTADTDFGAVRGIRRVDPLDERALRRLLAT
jgi:predicted nucleic acid-binding protein